MGKAKGGRTERELMHLFYSSGKFMPCRIAGSGSTPLPAPDLVVGGMNRVLAIECKSGKGRRDIKKEQIQELSQFSKLFGAEPWIAVRFNNMPWYFLQINQLGVSSGKNYFIDTNLVKKRGIRFEEVLENFNKKKFNKPQ